MLKKYTIRQHNAHDNGILASYKVCAVDSLICVYV